MVYCIGFVGEYSFYCVIFVVLDLVIEIQFCSVFYCLFFVEYVLYLVIYDYMYLQELYYMYCISYNKRILFILFIVDLCIVEIIKLVL